MVWKRSSGQGGQGILVGAGADLEDVGASPSSSGSAAAVRPAACLASELLKTEFVVEHPQGSLKGLLWRAPGEGKWPAVLVNCGAYTGLVKVIEKEAPLFATRGYAYVLVWNEGTKEEVADRIFGRWAADAEALLDWVGAQEWCDGRVATHGVSLVGSTAFAAVQAGAAPAADAPASRPRVVAAAPSLSFSRIQPTVFLFGHGVALELVLRFLWLAEVGVREGELRGLTKMKKLAAFFAFSEWPGLRDVSLQGPVDCADEFFWQRRNFLWRQGMASRLETDPFWSEGRDRLCDIRGLGTSCPAVRLVSGWWDIFLRQALEDFASCVAARGSGGGGASGIQLIVYCGGHFGVGGGHGKDIALATLAWYDEHVLALSSASAPSSGAAVQLEVFGGQPNEFLGFPTWPPPGALFRKLFVQGTVAAAGAAGVPGRLGGLSAAPPAPGSGDQLRYVYDPKDPTPYVGGGWLNFRKDGPKEQRALELRKDVLVITSEPFDETCDLVGVVKATLFMQCSAPECDVVARLCIVRAPKKLRWPDLRGWSTGLGPGSSLNLCESLVRVPFAADSSGAPGVKRIDIDVGVVCCRVERGDQLRLHVCSAVHPRAMRHPLGTGDWLLSSEVGPPAELTLISDSSRPSCVELPFFAPASASTSRCV